MGDTHQEMSEPQARARETEAKTGGLGRPASLNAPESVGLVHRAFDKLYPLIRFAYESVMGHAWFTQVTSQVWLGGAPSYERDYRFILDRGIGSVLNIRAERSDETAFYERHGIEHIRYSVPDVTVPDQATISHAVDWIAGQTAGGRVVLVHCAKGRGRSATLVAAYLMREKGMSFEQARDMLRSLRRLSKLEDRHRIRLESWIRSTGAT